MHSAYIVQGIMTSCKIFQYLSHCVQVEVGACSWAKNIGNEAKKPSEKTRRRLLHTREVDYLESRYR